VSVTKISLIPVTSPVRLNNKGKGSVLSRWSGRVFKKGQTMLERLLATIVASFVSLAQPYADQTGTVLSIRQTRCLTETTYFESRGEGLVGSTAVAYVALNRAAEKGQSICTVVHESGQFSYYDARHKHTARDVDAWIASTHIAIATQLGLIANPIGNATFYNTKKMPSWTDAVFEKKINHHYFYITKSAIHRPALLMIPTQHDPVPSPARQSDDLLSAERIAPNISDHRSAPPQQIAARCGESILLCPTGRSPIDPPLVHSDVSSPVYHHDLERIIIMPPSRTTQLGRFAKNTGLSRTSPAALNHNTPMLLRTNSTPARKAMNTTTVHTPQTTTKAKPLSKQQIRFLKYPRKRS
jgi:hypothetical protein